MPVGCCIYDTNEETDIQKDLTNCLTGEIVAVFIFNLCVFNTENGTKNH